MGGEIAWVFDDSRILTLNIREGTRAKVWAEYYLDRDGRSFGTMGLDARKYIRLFSNSILALRVAEIIQLGRTSFYIC